MQDTQMKNKLKPKFSLKNARARYINVFFFMILILFFTLLFNQSSQVIAGNGAPQVNGIGRIGVHVTEDMIGELSGLVISLVYILGIGLGFVGLVKFKAYKLNPNQEKLSTACIYLAVATGAIWMPTIMGTVNTSVFEGDPEEPGTSFGPQGILDNSSQSRWGTER